MFISIKDGDETKSFNSDNVDKIVECPQKYVASTMVYFTSGSWLNFSYLDVADITNIINKQLRTKNGNNN